MPRFYFFKNTFFLPLLPYLLLTYAEISYFFTQEKLISSLLWTFLGTSFTHSEKNCKETLSLIFFKEREAQSEIFKSFNQDTYFCIKSSKLRYRCHHLMGRSTGMFARRAPKIIQTDQSFNTLKLIKRNFEKQSMYIITHDTWGFQFPD